MIDCTFNRWIHEYSSTFQLYAALWKYVHHMIDQLVEPPLKAIIWSVILYAALSVSHIVVKEFWPTLLHSVALV